MSRPYTESEVREKFIDYLDQTAKYWLSLPDKTCSERVYGALFSALVALDGGSAELPAFIVAPDPNSGDRAYYERRGENWYPDDIDISGMLHELFARRSA
jgi:hypothetical protein